MKQAQYMKSEAIMRAYFHRVSARLLLVTHACYRLSDKRRELGLTQEEEQAADALGFCRAHLEAENGALAYLLFEGPERMPNGALAQVLTALGDDQYKGKGGPFTAQQQVVARLARYERQPQEPRLFEQEPAVKQLRLFGEEACRG